MPRRVLVDSSLWIEVWRGGAADAAILDEHLRGGAVVISRFVEVELLMGARDESEWRTISAFMARQSFLPTPDDLWPKAARIYFDLRRRGLSVRSANDCCLAQQALEEDLLLLHRDRDFRSIATVRPLQQTFVDL